MAQKETGFEAMMNIWQEGQETFLSAQKVISEGFQQSFNNPYDSPKETKSDPLSQWQSLINSWAPGWNPTADVFANKQSGIDALLNPMNWTKFAPEQLRTILETIASGPQFSDLATSQINGAESWRETLDYQKAASEFSTILNNAWEKTYASFSEHYSLDDLKSANMNDALEVWLKTANTELQKMQRTAPFMDAQKKMMRASAEIKSRQRDIAEVWSEAYQMPTRTEIDDLTKTVHELRRELRKLKRQVEDLKSGGLS